MVDAPPDVVAAVERAWDEGCPVAGQDPGQWAERAKVAVRRWRSAGRRHGRHLTPEIQVEDLAKGLRDAFEPDPTFVGPLMEDYRFLAARLAVVLTARD